MLYKTGLVVDQPGHGDMVDQSTMEVLSAQNAVTYRQKVRVAASLEITRALFARRKVNGTENICASVNCGGPITSERRSSHPETVVCQKCHDRVNKN